MSSGSILMIEPNPGILIVARNVLARSGFEVLAVSNIKQGLKLSKQRTLDVVLLDAKQADASSIRTLADSHPGGVAVVLTVQRNRDVITLESMEQTLNDVSDVIEKPFSPDRLLQVVEGALDRWNERTQPLEELIVLKEEIAEERSVTDHTQPFPFADLLQQDDDGGERFPDETRVNLGLPAGAARAARLTAEIGAALRETGVTLNAVQIGACVRACESVLEREGLLGQEAEERGTLAVGGFIERMPVDQILQLATSADAPALLRMEQGETSIEVFYQGSNVVFARQVNMPEGFTIGRTLVALGKVKAREVERVLEPRRGLRGRLGQRLVQIGVITPAELQGALSRQTEELVYEAVRWGHGRFAVYAGCALPHEARDAGLTLPIHHLLLEGMRRLDEWRRIAGELGDMGTILGRVQPERPDALAALKPEDRLILEYIDGRSTVMDLVQRARRPTFHVFRALHNLANQRLVVSTDPAVV